MGQKVILCTGGIGSGKSYVLRVFNALGIPSYDCDESAKSLYDRDAVLLKEIAEIAGEDVVVDGVLHRPLFASRIFSDQTMLERVEEVVHPAVIRDFERWRKSVSSDIVLIESAILLEKPALAGVADFVLTIAAPIEVRIERAMKRDGSSREQVMERLENQWSDEQRIGKSDFVIYTNDRHAILPEVLKIVESVRNGNR